MAGRRMQELQIIDDDQGKALGTLEPSRPGAKRHDAQGRRVVDEKGHGVKLPAGAHHLLKGGVGKFTLADLVRRHAGGFGEDAGGQLLGRHLEREETDDAAVHHLLVPVLVHFRLVGLGGMVGDVGGERRLAHRRPARQHHQIRGMQSAEQLVDIGESGGETGESAFALVRRLGHVDGARQRLGEG